MEKIKSIVFTGGGSPGHVTPNIALIRRCQQEGWQVSYVGSPHGVEVDLIKPLTIPYYAVASGKLRRYFSWQNFIDPLKILIGIIQAFFILRRIKPRIVFSKGGFVAVPVVIAAWLNKIPIIAHESDLTPGLANKLTFPFVKKICVTFPESCQYFKNKDKVTITGSPIRAELLQGNAEKGREFCGFLPTKRILLVMGGGLGSTVINKTLIFALPDLLKDFQIIHLCGKGKTDQNLVSIPGYKQFEYIHEQMPDIFACADIVISRAGANSLLELLTLQKPHILIPLSRQASRGDQIINANYFNKQGFSQVILEDELSRDKLVKAVNKLKEELSTIKEKLRQFTKTDSISLIYQLIIDSVWR